MKKFLFLTAAALGLLMALGGAARADRVYVYYDPGTDAPVQVNPAFAGLHRPDPDDPRTHRPHDPIHHPQPHPRPVMIHHIPPGTLSLPAR
jgi:hypothetical protein